MNSSPGLPAPPRRRIRLLQQFAAFAAVGAVVLLLALIWQLLPHSSPAPAPAVAPSGHSLQQAQAQAAGRLAQILQIGRKCLQPLAQDWAGLREAERTNDLNQLRLRDDARRCLGEGGLSGQILVVDDDGRQVLLLNADSQPALAATNSAYREARHQAVTSGQAVVTLAEFASGGSEPGAVDVLQPAKTRNNPVVVLRYTPRHLLRDAELVPLAQRYALELRAGNGPPLRISHPEVAAGAGTAVEVPGTPLRLSVLPARSEAALPAGSTGQQTVDRLRLLLTALAVGLVGLVLWAMFWLARTHRTYLAQLQQQIAAREEQDTLLQREMAARRQSEEAERVQAAFRKDIEDSVNVGLRVLDAEGKITYVNKAFCAMTGWAREALVGARPPYPFWPEGETLSLVEHLRVILAGQARPEGYVVTLCRRDGTPFHARVVARAMNNGKGWILTTTDVTKEVEDRRRIENLNEELRRQSSVFMLGERAGELLHKISNHSGACANACDGILENLRQGRTDLIPHGARIASRAAQDMRAIVERFRPWLRDEPKPEPVALRGIVMDAIAQESSYADTNNVMIHNGVEDDIPLLMLDRPAMVEVFSNLIHNAVWSMQDTPVAGRLLTIDCGVDRGLRQVQIFVRDRGCGIPPADRERIFERGYTTREGGNGWGLFVCRNWVEKHGGTLAATASQPRGSVFIITLPMGEGSDSDNKPA